jgi:lipopolysaccharide export system protein LptC
MSPAQQSARERMLDNLRRRRPDVTTGIAKRSRAVTIFKALLPVAAVVLLIALAIAPGLRGGPGADRVTYKVPNTPQSSGSHMENAQYKGLDQHGQPFTLTAKAANDQGTDDVALAGPQGDISLASGAWLMLKSETGLFNQKLQTLGLKGNVTLYRNDGTTVTSPDARIDLKQGDANSASPVQAAGPFGTLNAAGGFNLTDRGADVVFKGPATLTLNQTDSASSQ